MQKNADQNNSEYGHFLRTAMELMLGKYLPGQGNNKNTYVQSQQ